MFHKFRYKFICNSNGQWEGEWPVCVPIVTCPKNEIIDNKDPSVISKKSVTFTTLMGVNGLLSMIVGFDIPVRKIVI